jgi:hypothetical protein
MIVQKSVNAALKIAAPKELRFGDDAQMKACANMCRRYSKSCRQIAMARA